MRMSARRIRSINRSIARVNGIIWGTADGPRRFLTENAEPRISAIAPHTIRIVAVPKPRNA